MTNPSSLALHTALQWMVRHPTEAGDPRSFEKSDHRGTIAALRGTEKHMRNAVPMAQLLSIAQNERPWALTRTKGYIENSHRLHKKRQREHYKQKREWERQERGQDVQQWKRRWKSSQTSSPLEKSGGATAWTLSSEPSGGIAWTLSPKASSRKRERERREERDRHVQQWKSSQTSSPVKKSRGIAWTFWPKPSSVREQQKRERERREERDRHVQQWKSSQTSSPVKKSRGNAWTFWPKPSSPHEQQKRQRERREEQDRHKQQWVAKQKLSSQTKGIFGTTSFSPSVSPQTVSRPRPVLPVLPSSQLTKNVTRHMWQRIDQKK